MGPSLNLGNLQMNADVHNASMACTHKPRDTEKTRATLKLRGLLNFRVFLNRLGFLFVVAPVSLVIVVVAWRGPFPFGLDNDLVFVFRGAFVSILLSKDTAAAREQQTANHHRQEFLS